MKALEILRQIEISNNYCNDCGGLDYCNNNNPNKICGMVCEIDEAIKELEILDNDLKDLFSCIELTEDESYGKRFTSIETYLIRLSKFIK